MAEIRNNEIEQDWVDLFTNSAFIQNLNPGSLTDILLGQRFPKEIFFSMIHEATHHWCFSSMLGNTLFCIKMNAYLAAGQPLAKVGEKHLHQLKIYADYTRFHTIKKIYDPLTEGLALFAEYDSCATATEAVPPYLVFMTMMFSGIKREDWAKYSQADLEYAYNLFLYERRISSREGQDRKANLLVSPIDISLSPYLSGYLFVKNLQGILIGINQKFQDPNIFLNYIKAYYFEDPGLISLLLDDSMAEENILPEFARYFNERTARLTGLPANTADEFEQTIIGRGGLSMFYRNILSDANDGAVIKGRVESRLEAVFDEYPAAYFLQFMRSFFKLTRLKCYLIVTPNHVKTYIRLPGSAVITNTLEEFLKHGLAVKRDGYIDVFSSMLPNLEHYENYEGEAFFEKHIFFGPDMKMFDVLLGGKAPIFYPVGDTFTQEEQIVIREYFTHLEPNITKWDMDDLLKEYWKNDDYIAEVEQFHKEHNYDIIGNYYEQLALHCPDSFLTQVRSLMKEHGFWAILNNRVDFVNLLSLLSLITSLVIYGKFKNIGELKSFIAEEHTSQDIEDLEQQLKHYGFELFIKAATLTLTIGI